MKNIIKIILPITIFTTSALASNLISDNNGLTIKPNIKFDFGYGVLNNSGKDSNNKVSANRDNIGFLSQGKIALKIQNKLDNGITYGAQIAVKTTARSDRSTPSHIFFESAAGKWEFGSDKSVMTKMKITGWGSFCASGGLWDIWATPDIRNHKIPYVTNSGNFLDTKMRNVEYVEYSRKISYYTPKFYGFQVGVSYIPDTTNQGSVPVRDASPDYHQNNKILHGYAFDIRDGIALGVTKEFKFNESNSFKLSLVQEFGKVAAKKPSADDAAANKQIDPTNLKFKRLYTYNIGAEFKTGQLSVAGSYANYMKSLTSNSELADPVDRRNSYVYDFGIKYNFDVSSISAHYFASNNKTNKVSAITFGVDRKWKPGLVTYLEGTFFDAKGSYRENDTDTKFIDDKHNGTILIAGIKVEV